MSHPQVGSLTLLSCRSTSTCRPSNGRPYLNMQMELSAQRVRMSIVLHVLLVVNREGDPKAWSMVLFAALGSWGKPVPRGHTGSQQAEACWGRVFEVSFIRRVWCIFTYPLSFTLPSVRINSIGRDSRRSGPSLSPYPNPAHLQTEAVLNGGYLIGSKPDVEDGKGRRPMPRGGAHHASTNRSFGSKSRLRTASLTRWSCLTAVCIQSLYVRRLE
jgi:hypothetical protein